MTDFETHPVGTAAELARLRKQVAAAPSPDADTRFLLDAAKGLLFAHDHGNGLEGWHTTREKLREAIERFELAEAAA